ncbi:MAG: hypothetical protein EOO45_06985 [Flavobacterium sp.]|nr:MAG: hypothetical protein EOO45_06985 [Flavobacterium sp.]
MVKILQFLFLLIFIPVSAQQDYDFDYTLEYEYSGKGFPDHRRYIFVNSKDNSSRLYVWENKDKLALRLTIGSREYFTLMLRDNFFVESIALRCPPFSLAKNGKRVKDYTILKVQDTVINTERLSHYILKPVNVKKIKRDNLMPEHFLVAQHPDFNVPFISKTHPSYAIWEAYGKIPHGVMHQHYYLDEQGKKVHSANLVQILKANKYISIYKSCK